MIRLKRFTQASYERLRNNYLEAIGTKELAEAVKKSILPDRLQEYLFEGRELIEDRLYELLAGPDQMPRSFGGTGKFTTMREFFENVIRAVGIHPGTQLTNEEKKSCESLFDYQRLLNRKCRLKGISGNTAYWLMDQLDVRVCPYCNRMYTTHISRCGRDGGIIRADFDHFYPRSRYPYLSLCLFNLIPSCSYCNKLKSDHAESYIPDSSLRDEDNNIEKSRSIIYPYDESFDEPDSSFYFQIIPNRPSDIIMTGRSDEFTVKLQCRAPNLPEEMRDVLIKTEGIDNFDFLQAFPSVRAHLERATESKKLFQLEKLYDKQKKEIMRLIQLRYVYNQCSIKMILKPLMEESTMDDLSINSMLYCAFLGIDEWAESPLNKLKHDILNQLEG